MSAICQMDILNDEPSALPVTPRSDAGSRKERFFRISPDRLDPASERGVT